LGVAQIKKGFGTSPVFAAPFDLSSCDNPRYEGFGRNATGGLGQSVYHVTNLNNSGSGSLRDALSSGNRCILFDVSGTINLSSDLRVKSNTTIDGLSSPNGVTLHGRTLIMEGGVSNIIVRGLRVRDTSDDGIRVYGGSHDIVIDHVSVSGFGDGAVDITESSYNVTLSWSILGNGVSNHNFVTLISYGAEKISVHHNLYSNGWDRNPKCALDDGSTSNPTDTVNCDVRNNLIWNYMYNGSRNDNATNSNIIGNYYYSSFGNRNAITSRSGSRVYAEGNYSKNGFDVSTGNRSQPFVAADVNTQNVITAASMVLQNAGARGDNFNLDGLDQTYISQVAITETPIPTSPTATMTPVPPIITATVTAQPENSPSLPGLLWEAEQGEISSPFVVENGIVSQNILSTNPEEGGRAFYRFSIQEAGDYIVRALVNVPDSGKNSFFVGMDTEPDTSMIWDVPLTNSFEERIVSWRGGVSPDGTTSNTVFNLTSGEHSLIIRGREAGALIDKVEVVKVDALPVPTFTATPIPVETQISTETVTPVPPTMTATITTQPENSPSLPGLLWEAEQGEITSPFVVENGIVYQSESIYDPQQGGQALYRFTLEAPGDYVIRAVVRAANIDENSFFVNVDGAPSSDMIWDIEPTNGLEARYVYWRLDSPMETFKAPQVFSLSAGEHVLIFRGRERLSGLDRIEVIPAGNVPSSTPVPTATATNTPISPTMTASLPTDSTTATLPTDTPLPTFTPEPSDTTPPIVVDITSQGNTSFQIRFSEDVGTTGSDAANFGLSGVSVGPIVMNSISYDSNTFTTTLEYNNGSPPPPDFYTLTVAGNTSVTDMAGNKLDGNADGVGGDDFIHSFSVQAPTATPTETVIPPTFTSTPEPPTATATVTASPMPTATPSERIYDDQDSAFIYSANWENEYRRAAYHGSFKTTTSNGADVTLNFIGQSFSVIYKTGREYRSIDVYLDGNLVGSINEQDWRQGYQQRWDYPGLLVSGPHTLKLVFVTENRRDKTKGSLDAVIIR